MKICLLANNASVHNQRWISALANRPGIDLHVVSFDTDIKFPNVTYHPLKRRTGNKTDYLLNITTLKKIVRKIKPDLLHAQYATSYGFMAARINFHPFVVTGWGADIFDSPQNPVMKRILKYTFAKADTITVLSQITLKEIKKLTAKNIELIPFGVDTEKFLPTQNKNSNTIHIGTIRTLSEKYGVDYLIRAFALLTPKYNNLKLEIVGDGPQRDFLEKLASDLKISDKITFHGFVNQNTDFEKYLNLLHKMDIFSILSILDSESFGVAAVEAMACAIPVVASDVGGLPEVVGNNDAGLIVPARDTIATANAIEKLIANSELRKKIGTNARNKTLEIYNWQKNVDKMIETYKNLIC